MTGSNKLSELVTHLGKVVYGVEPLEYPVSYVQSHCWGEAGASEGPEQGEHQRCGASTFSNSPGLVGPSRFGEMVGD
jgi:hypothetical protein